VVLLLLVALTPPLVNVNRLRRRIAASMSASLGRPVHMDSVRLNLLPVPGFTLENLVVSEDPAFGYEPTIRANTVQVTLRPSSLWRRQVEFSNIRFIDPSLNLVRNADGRWNLESLLMHAASVETAPTAQRKAGPAPRFPYIEARNARVNLKLGQMKQPFSLIDADFAVWLPTPQQWNIRLQARPARTDSNITDAGTVRLEGSLDRAARMEDAGIHMQSSWHDAQLGEASRLLSGSDAGWRGSLNIDTSLSGTLRQADFATAFHANDVRRADFLPVQMLDLTVRCASVADTLRGTMTQLHCALPIDSAEPVSLDVAALDLDAPRQAASALRIHELPLPTVLDWARLISRRIPADLNPAGSVSGELDWSGVVGMAWSGGLTATLPSPSPENGAPAKPPPQVFTLVVPQAPNPQLQLQLEPAALHIVATPPASPAQLSLSGLAGRDGYTLNLAGTATAEQVLDLSQLLPPLSDGVAAALPRTGPLPRAPLAINITCSRQWPALQTCAAAPALATPRKRRGAHHRS
jgi:AsmA protein